MKFEVHGCDEPLNRDIWVTFLNCISIFYTISAYILIPLIALGCCLICCYFINRYEISYNYIKCPEGHNLK